MAMVLLLAAQGLNGFTDFFIGSLPLYVFLIMVGKCFHGNQVGCWHLKSNFEH